jgi:large subunit ribosomal protein L7/L12
MALSDKAQKILDLLKELNAVEINELVKSLEEEFGVSAAAPVMMAGG